MTISAKWISSLLMGLILLGSFCCADEDNGGDLPYLVYVFQIVDDNGVDFFSENENNYDLGRHKYN